MNKYLKVLKKIDKVMTEKGYKLVSVSDGYEALSSLDSSKNALYNWATQCDCGTMTYITPYDGAKRCTFYLVYGNEVYETISDASWNTPKAYADTEAVFEAIFKAYDPDYCHA
jgi:hypothetical protein